MKEKGNDGADGGEHFASADRSRSSFTKLLINQSVSVSDAAPVSTSGQVQALLPSTTAVRADYFGQAGFFTRLPSQTYYLNSSPLVDMVATGEQLETQQFSLMQDHFDYNFNISIASGLAGFQRGTLQSNSSAHLTQQHLQHQLLRFPSPSSSYTMMGSNLQFVTPALAVSSAENFFCSGLDGRLQLSREPPTPFLLDGYRPSDLNGKGKS